MRQLSYWPMNRSDHTAVDEFYEDCHDYVYRALEWVEGPRKGVHVYNFTAPYEGDVVVEATGRAFIVTDVPKRLGSVEGLVTRWHSFGGLHLHSFFRIIGPADMAQVYELARLDTEHVLPPRRYAYEIHAD